MPNGAETNETESARELRRQQTKARQEQQKLENITLRQREQMADYERQQQEAMQGRTGERVSPSPQQWAQGLKDERQRKQAGRGGLTSQLPERGQQEGVHGSRGEGALSSPRQFAQGFKDEQQRRQQEERQGKGEGNLTPAKWARAFKEEKQKSRNMKEALASQLPGAEALAKIEEVKKAVERLKWIYRIVNGTAGVTLWGLILTFLAMNGQLIFGNLFKVKFAPPLNLAEGIIIAFIDFILFIILLIVAFLIILLADMYYKIYSLQWPWVKAKQLWDGFKVIWDLLGGK